MRVSTPQYNSNTLNPYQADKEQVAANMDSLKTAISKNDFESAKDILSQTEKLFDKKTSKRFSDQQAQLKEDLQSLSEAIAKKDPAKAKESANKIQEEIKTNKNLMVRTHSMTDITSSLSNGLMNALYA